MYRTLNPDRIIKTLETLGQRIAERFPGSGLSNVCDDLIGIAKQTSSRADEVAKAHWGIRLVIASAVFAVLAGLALLALQMQTFKLPDQLSDVMQGLDATVNMLVLLGGATVFAATLETRWKRSRALKALYEFRSIVHVIDMHQLTKDPSMLGQARTTSSPDRDMTPFELVRYLDYCSEMLSLTGKLAALYSEKLNDPVVVDTVGDIERLTSNLSSKIWQKITIVQGLEGRDYPLPAAPPPPAIAAPKA